MPDKPVKLADLLTQLDDAVETVHAEEAALIKAKRAYDAAVETHGHALDDAQRLQNDLQQRIATLVPAGRVRAS